MREVAPLLDGAPLFLEDVGLGVDLQRRVRQPEAARQRADGDQHRRGMRVLGVAPPARRRSRSPAGSRRCARRGRHCRRRTARCRRARAPAGCRRPSRGRGRGTPSPAGSETWRTPASRLRARALRGAAPTERDVRARPRSTNALLGRQRRTWPRAAASRKLVSSCSRTLTACCSTCSYSDTTTLDAASTGSRDTETVARIADRRRVVESFADGNDEDLIGRAGRSLRRRIEPSQRLDHVADELDAHRLGVGRRKHIDDAAANREGAVLVDRILASEPGVDEQIGQIAAARFPCRPNLDRGPQQALRGLTRGSSAAADATIRRAVPVAAACSARARAAATRKCGVMPR